MLKLRLERTAQRLLVPIFLAPSPTPLLLAVTAACPALIAVAVRRLVIQPRKTRLRAKGVNAEEAVNVNAAGVNAREGDVPAGGGGVAADRRVVESSSGAAAAAVEARLLLHEAAQRAREERECGGLLLLAAYYGDVDLALRQAAETDAGRQPAGQGEGAAPHAGAPAWVDVRIALQFAVADSQLKLPAGSKQHLRGFAPVARAPPASRGAASPSPRLWIRYELGGEARTLLVDDEEEVHIGPPAARRGR
jgi:hypothetical protein